MQRRRGENSSPMERNMYVILVVRVYNCMLVSFHFCFDRRKYELCVCYCNFQCSGSRITIELQMHTQSNIYNFPIITCVRQFVNEAPWNFLIYVLWRCVYLECGVAAAAAVSVHIEHTVLVIGPPTLIVSAATQRTDRAEQQHKRHA